MYKLRWAFLALVLVLPLALGCDTGTAGNTAATAIPTEVSGGLAATATAAAPDVNAAATTAAGAAGAVLATATAAAPDVNAAATTAAGAVGGALATATAAAPDVNGAATAATTAVTGAGNLLVPQVASNVSAADQAYLNKVNALGGQMLNAPEITAAFSALTDAATKGVAGQTVDTAAVTAALTKASTKVSDLSTQATALQPPADMQAVQTQLMKAVSDQTALLTAAQQAVGTQNWTAAAQAAGQIAGVTLDLTTLQHMLTTGSP